MAASRPSVTELLPPSKGRPARGTHAVQLEINRGLYMNERTLQKASGFDALADDLSRLSAELMSMPDHNFLDDFQHRPLAAE